MCNLRMLVVAGTLAFSPALSRAAISACATSANGNTFASYGSASSANGCSEIDKTFTNLSLDSATGTNPLSTSNLKIWASGTVPSGDTLAPVTAKFDAAGPPNAWNVSGKNNSQDTTFSYVATANTGGSFPSPATPGLIWAVDSLQLVVTPGADSNSAATSTVTLNFCLAASTTSGCSNLGTIVASFVSGNAPTYTCSFTGCLSGTSNIVNFAGVTQIAISESVHLGMDATNGHAAVLNNIANTFGETAFASVPETSTTLLLGVGLLVIGLARYRTKKS